MKLFNLTIITFLLFTSCVDRNPELDEDDYIEFQAKYESYIKNVSTDKAEYYAAHKVELQEKIELFKTLKDSTQVFEDANEADDFYFNDVILNAVNYSSSLYDMANNHNNRRNLNNSDKKVAKVAFLPVNNNEYAISKYRESYDLLYNCDFNDDEACGLIEKGILESFLNVEYAFIFQGFDLMQPTLEGSESFSSGMFFGSIVFYDLKAKKALYKFSFSATNSEEISFQETKYSRSDPQIHLDRDYQTNISKAISTAIKKHFTFY